MTLVFALSGRLSHALAQCAKLVLGAIILVVISDVVLRNLGLRPLSWSISAAEYGLLYAAFLPMPWLVRIKGHVFVEFFRQPLPPRGKALLERAVYIACIGLCLYLCWHASLLLIDAVRTGAYETRTFDMPKWAVFLPVALSFLLSAIEWTRYLLGKDSLYDLDPLEQEGL